MAAKFASVISPSSLRSFPAEKVVDAYVQIRPSATSRSSADKEADVLKVVERIEKLTQTKAKYHYLDLLDAVHVSAVPKFFIRLFDQPEVEGAQPAPESNESGLIAPKNARVVDPSAVNVPLRKRTR
jgi:hypothetical protein